MTTSIEQKEGVWLNAIAIEKSEQIAEELIMPSDEAEKTGSTPEPVGDLLKSGVATKCPPVKGTDADYKVGLPTDAAIVPPNAGNPIMPEQVSAEPTLSFGEQMLVDRMDDLITIMSDIRDRIAANNGGDAVSLPQSVEPLEDAGSNLSSALLAALTITDGILTTRK